MSTNDEVQEELHKAWFHMDWEEPKEESDEFFEHTEDVAEEDPDRDDEDEE